MENENERFLFDKSLSVSLHFLPFGVCLGSYSLDRHIAGRCILVQSGSRCRVAVAPPVGYARYSRILAAHTWPIRPAYCSTSRHWSPSVFGHRARLSVQHQRTTQVLQYLCITCVRFLVEAGIVDLLQAWDAALYGHKDIHLWAQEV